MNKRIVVTAAACFLAGTAGFLAGSRVTAHSPPHGPDASFKRDPSPSERPADTRNPTSNRAVSTARNRTPEQLAKLKSDLRKRYSGSASALHDWILRGESAAMLAAFSPEELEAFYRELQPTENEAMSGRQPEWRSALIRDIIIAWAHRDPAEASFSHSSLTLENAAFQIWLRRDPEAAADWLRDGPIPPGKERLVGQLQLDMVNHLADTDFAAAKQALAGLPEAERERALGEWSRRFAHDPAKRSEIIELLRRSLDAPAADKLLGAMIGEMALKSPSEASGFVEALDVSEDRKHALSEQVLGQWARQAPQEAFAAWAELQEQEVPKPLLGALDVWSLNSPGAEQALDWVMNLHPGAAREEFKAHLLTHMFPSGRTAQATELAASLEDPVERLRHLKRIKRIMDDAGPSHAAEWMSQRSPEDRAALDTPLE